MTDLATCDLKVTDGGEAWFIEITRIYENSKNALKSLSRQPSVDGGDDSIPASAAASFRSAANALHFAITQRSGRSSPGLKRAGGGAVEAEEPVANSDLTDEELFSAMQGQWVEVECLLRVQLRTEDALEEARERVAASLAFDTELGQLASDQGVLKGAIFQALLARADGSDDATAPSVGLEMSEDAWEAQACGADALRKLVRIKVQDDNDLKAANGALTSCSDFFANLRVYASRHATPLLGVINKLEEGY